MVEKTRKLIRIEIIIKKLDEKISQIYRWTKPIRIKIVIKKLDEEICKICWWTKSIRIESIKIISDIGRWTLGLVKSYDYWSFWLISSNLLEIIK